MAIKGKSKGRSAKAVTRGPKPVYQPVKKRLLAKREFWLVILSILGVMVVVGLVAGFIAERNSSAQDELEQRMRATMSSFQGQVEPVLTTIGQAQPPAGYKVFTDLATAVDNLVAEKPGRAGRLEGAHADGDRRRDLREDGPGGPAVDRRDGAGPRQGVLRGVRPVRDQRARRTSSGR